jgi:hypothetical protein
MIMLCRHDTKDKYNGLTYFIVPIAKTKGVTVRPLIKMTGETASTRSCSRTSSSPIRCASTPSARAGPSP